MPKSELKTRSVIAMVLFPDFQLLDATGPAAVFEAADFFAGEKGGYDLRMMSHEGGLVCSSGGVEVQTSPISTAQNIDTLMIPGGSGTRSASLDPLLLECLCSLAPHCRRVASVCTGTFILAKAGLIDGLRVTTHWRHSQQLANNFPKVKVAPNQIWVRDGKIWSSAGVSAGIDLALALVSDDFGNAIAKNVAREIVVYYKRPGGQSQFSTIEELCDGDNRFKPVLAWIRENIGKSIKVEHLAEVAAMSPRNFARQFQKVIGRTPAKAVEQIRVEVAKNLLESTDLVLSQIANRCGFTDAEIMRRAFIRLYGQAPRSLRTEVSK